MRRIHRLAAVASLAAVLALSACGGDTNDTGSGDPSDTGTGDTGTNQQLSIEIVSKGFQHQFWQAVKQGAEAEAAAQGVAVNFIGPASESEVEAQMTMLQNALAKKPSAIGFAALDSKAASQILTEISAANIPVIAFDSGVDSDIPLTTASTDNQAAAKEAAKHMCELIGNQGKVGLIVHDQVSQSGTDRRDGFLAGMKEYCPDVTVLDPQYGGGDQAKSADIAKAIIAANPDLTGLYGSNEGSAIGALKGLQESGKTGITLVGFDSGQAQLDAIRSGEMAGAITQNPVGMGAEVVKAAIKAINGETLPKTIDTGFYWYDQSNIDDPTIAACLYE
jgi:ribose transport system substrate-binding protein